MIRKCPLCIIPLYDIDPQENIWLPEVGSVPAHTECVSLFREHHPPDKDRQRRYENEHGTDRDSIPREDPDP